jgi:hypothetical protein
MNTIKTGDLHSGMTSSAPKTSVDRRKELIEKTVQQKQKLAPYAEVVSAMVDADKEKIVEKLRLMVVEPLPEEDVKLELLVLQRTYAYLTDFSNRVSNILRTKEVTEPKESKDA